MLEKTALRWPGKHEPLPAKVNPIVLCCLFLVAAAAPLFGQDASPTAAKKVICGWYPWEPYQFNETINGVSTAGGLDILLIQAIMENAGYQVEFREAEQSDTLIGLQQGDLDMAGGATLTQEGISYVIYSKPYRFENNALFTRRKDLASLNAQSVEALLRTFKENGFRLGVTRGFIPSSEEIRRYLSAPPHPESLVEAASDQENLGNLLNGKADAVLLDRISGAKLIWQNDWASGIAELPMSLGGGPVRVMFSKTSSSAAMVKAFNQSLDEMVKKGDYQKVAKAYFIPILLSITTGQRWFFWVDLLGTIAFAISGLLLARKESYDIFGALVLASLPAVGGGILRDILVDRSPIGVLRNPIYLISIGVLVLGGYLMFWVHDRFVATSSQSGRIFGAKFLDRIVNVADALGLAAFIVVGVGVAVEKHCEPLWLWGAILATLTGAGGGILRDIVRADSNNPGLKGSFYPEIALVWGMAFSIFLNWQASRLSLDEVFIGMMVTIVGAFATRMIVIIKKIPSPAFNWKPSPRGLGPKA